MKKRDDLQIKCTFCDGYADVYEIWDTMTFKGYYYKCESCNWGAELDPKYNGQIETKEK